jgi:hypothetical protein
VTSDAPTAARAKLDEAIREYITASSSADSGPSSRNQETTNE